MEDEEDDLAWEGEEPEDEPARGVSWGLFGAGAAAVCLGGWEIARPVWAAWRSGSWARLPEMLSAGQVAFALFVMAIGGVLFFLAFPPLDEHTRARRRLQVLEGGRGRGERDFD